MSRDDAVLLSYIMCGPSEFPNASGQSMTGDLNEWVPKAQLNIRRILFGMFALGIVGGIYNDYVPWPWLSHAVKELSSALLIASLLGLTVDIFLKREFARDVFVAAFRYVLPDVLKEEVRRIINYKFLCIESTSIVAIAKMPNNLVRVSISHERVFKNITGHSESFVGSFAVDEWGFPERSAIDQCLVEGATTVDNPDYAGKTDAIGKRTESVEVKSGATIKSITRGSEVHRDNGELHMSFAHPSINPVVRVETYDGLSHSCTFGIPDERVIRSAISKQYKLDGSQFPGQHTRIRWWPA